MNIQQPTKINFKAKNPTIRFADDIARHVNKCYPRISSSRIDDFSCIYNFPEFRIRIRNKLNKTVRFECNAMLSNAESFIEKILAFIKPVKKYKLGNCGESGELSAIIAKMNGIKNCYLAGLETDLGINLDHTVLYVDDKKPYIIDAWLGFADYVPNAITAYNNIYRKHFDIHEGDLLRFFKIDNCNVEVLNQEFSQIQIYSLKKMFPEHIKKRGYV